MKKSLAIIITIAFCLSLFTGCENGCGIGLRLYESDYFIYTVGYGTNRVSILVLTYKGQEQEYLIVPEKIDSKEVVALSCSDYRTKKIEGKFGDKKYAGLQSDILKKIFIIPTVTVKSGTFFQQVKDNIEVFYISNDVKMQDNLHHYTYYYTKDNDEYKKRLEGRVANVSYYYNYEQSPNDGYYWIDNYDYGEKIEYIPEQPLRDGHTFDGWYKESECVNAWNFETDALPKVQLDDQGQEIYQETKLYAKWVKI